jgi:23S rRNA (cytosine1962-C5)-methyltransferase
LIVDRYRRHLVLQVNSLAIATRLECISQQLTDLCQAESITVRSEPGMAKAEGLVPEHGVIVGELPEGPLFIEENGLRFGVDLLSGQKTGFYLDQRDNRRVAAEYVRGRRVLDMFCFTGGFSLAASRLGDAQEVRGIDASQRAITMAQANAELNGISNARFDQQDCFKALDSMVASGERFGAVILDPPKFARTRKSLNEALRAYHRINRQAVRLLEPDGVLITCSCSGAVTREEFQLTLSGVAQKSGRDIVILQQRGPAADHPVSVTCPETDYLKCFICRVP